MAFPAAPYTPLAYDTGLDPLDEESGAQSLHPSYWNPDMARMQIVDYDTAYRNAVADASQTATAMPDDMSWSPTSAEGTLSSRSDAARSPGKQSHYATLTSVGSASLSPQADALIYTPASTMREYPDERAFADEFDADHISLSPTSNNSLLEDYVMVPAPRRNLGEAGARNGMISLRPPTSSSSTTTTNSSGALPPTTYPLHLSPHTSMSQPPPSDMNQSQQWQSFATATTTAATSAGMDESTYFYGVGDDSLFPSDPFLHEASSMPLTGFQPTNMHENHDLGRMPLRSLSYAASSTRHPGAFDAATTPLHHQSTQFVNHGYMDPTTDYAVPVSSEMNPFIMPPHFSGAMPPPNLSHAHPPYLQRVLGSSRSPHVLPSNAEPISPQNAPAQYSQQQQRQQQPPSNKARSIKRNLPPTTGPDRLLNNQRKRATVPNDAKPPSHNTKTASSSTRPLIKAEPGSTPPHSISAPRAERVRKGGRPRGAHLNDTSRVKSHAMRKVGACWRCALQRDPCDEGQPCGRCLMRSEKGQSYFFECDRSKLPDFVHDFLPPQASMTLMHSKQNIEDTVKQEVLLWDKDNGLDIYLSSGYGPPLRWRVHEFKPKTDELLYQLQFLQDRETGLSKCKSKYAPPFGLLKLDMSDDLHFHSYLDRLLEREQLLDFGWSCYEEESIFDEGEFQAKLLDLMCKLYISTTDQNLKTVLRDVLKMIIVTFIMGHTLTIVEETLPTVLQSVQHSARPSYLQKHTSPRLANRQLKFFFAIIRMNIYEKILKWQQQTLHTAGKKDLTWLPTFCATLGFAMVLEELQRTLQIQAEASVRKGEMLEQDAQSQAFNACDRIDERFKLLVGLFQCKYRDRTWSHGSFGPSTPELKEECSVEFLSEVRALVEERQDHLRSRENVPFGKETQGLYTTRLTARFLLPFLNLP